MKSFQSRLPLAWMSPRRAALGFAAHAAPSLTFVIAGIGLGPAALNIISVNVLAQLDPVVSIALAILGVFIGAGYAAARGAERSKWVICAGAQAAVTLVIVTAVMYFLLSRWGVPIPVDPLGAASILGICSAASAAVRVDQAASRHLITATYLADFDDVAIIVFATAAIPLLAGVAPAASVGLALSAGLIIATAGLLLFGRAHGEAERGVFVIGTVILLGGAAAYLSASPLMTGFVAGLLWARSQTSTALLVELELHKLQHPLIALLLIIAGASIQFTFSLLWIAAPLVLFRLTGKLLGAMILSRALHLSPGLVATVLIPPGVLGIALALNFQQVLTTGNTLLVSAVTLAAVVSEMLAAILVTQEDEI